MATAPDLVRSFRWGLAHLLAAVAILALAPTTTAAQDLGRATGLPVLVEVSTTPIPVRADGRYRLVYELHVTNVSTGSVRLQRVVVRSTDTLRVLEGPELDAAIKTIGAVPADGPTTLGSGRRLVIMLWLSVAQAPRSLTHRVEGLVPGDQVPLATESKAVAVTGTPVRIEPPLRGARWVAYNGPANDTHHRRSWLSFAGRPLVPERFAIDFLRADADGNPVTGDPADNTNYPGYGAEVVAVADARVVATRDGVPDNVPANRPPKNSLTADELGGNHVTLDLGQGRFVFYLHLRPGSVRVKPGDRVRAGQVLGQVGNSGNSTAPHLHFQVSDGPSSLTSDGLPFVFTQFTRDGQRRRDEMPLKDWVLEFR